MKHQKKYLSIISMLLAMLLLTFASCTKEKSNSGNGDESIGFGLFSSHKGHKEKSNSGNGDENIDFGLFGHKGHEYVDLGLPSGIKWATCNVGANSPEEYGDYFAWGETSPKNKYSLSNYKYCNGDEYSFTKYCTDSDCGKVDNKRTLDLEDDAAHVNWGGKWRMPTRAEQQELIDTNNCTWEWITLNGVEGYKVTSVKNGNSIFLPAAGCRRKDSLFGAGEYGYYWPRSLNTYAFSYDYKVYCYFDIENCFNSSARCDGHSVRAVCP